jgi:hypothetical protein
MSAKNHVHSLCATCTGFDWLAWLKYKEDRRYILHSRFENVFEAASTGCRLCKLIVQKYENVVSKMTQGVYEEGKMRSYHLNCPLKISATRSMHEALRVQSIQMHLLQDALGAEWFASYMNQGMPRNRRMRSPLWADFTVYLGVSVPFREFCAQ